jgi:hypothetical protein
MSLCDSVLSWDGILCHRCRQVLDSHVVRTMHDEDSCTKEKCERSDLHATQPPLERRDVHLWLHPAASLRSCATRSCKLCKLVLSYISNEDLQKLVSWQATLPATFHHMNYGWNTIWVYKPSADPRPETESFDPTINDNYSQSILRIDVENVLGENSKLNAMKNAN